MPFLMKSSLTNVNIVHWPSNLGVNLSFEDVFANVNSLPFEASSLSFTTNSLLCHLIPFHFVFKLSFLRFVV